MAFALDKVIEAGVASPISSCVGRIVGLNECLDESLLIPTKDKVIERFVVPFDGADTFYTDYDW